MYYGKDNLFNIMQKEKEAKHTKYTVSVRIKPNLNNDPVCIYAYQSKYIKQMRPKSILTYCFDKVFEQTQDNSFIYQDSLQKTVGFFCQKKINTTILAYGQTGSGKTYTLFGSKSKDQKGLVDYMVEDIVNYATEKKTNLRCSFMQIYKQKVTDLMTSLPVQLRQSNQGQLSLQNLKVFEIGTKEQLLQLLRQAHSNKIFGNSYINSESSRSHVVFTIQLQKRKFNVVDLCGSEVLTYQFNQQQRDETNSINLSLFTLNAVINDLAFSNNNKNKFIPFRNSVLTRILKQSLLEMSKSQIYLFCNVSPELKHQNFTCSTLRFGQLAISIDEANNAVEEKVNLSQQKRQKKRVSNIIDIKPTINQNPIAKIPWNTKIIKIFSNQVRVFEWLQENPECHILSLHAYGNGCDGTDWSQYISYLSKQIRANFYSVDFPGFGQSQGKRFTSRAQKFTEKEQSIDFMMKLFEHFGFNSKKKVVLLGYDLGGAIALSCGFHSKLMKAVSTVITLHPTWTDSIQKLAVINVPTLLLWFPLQDFHLISAGQKMSKAIKTSRLYRFNINPVDYNSVGCYYGEYAEQMVKIMAEFLREWSLKPIQQNEEGRGRGKIIEQQIQVLLNEEEQKLIKAREAVQEIFKYISEGSINEVYEAISKGGPNKPKFMKLIGQLPSLELSNFTWQYLYKYGLVPCIKETKKDEDLPFLIPGQQIHIETLINLNCLLGAQKYLAYDGKGEIGITHKAYVSGNQTEEDIFKNEEVLVTINDVNGVKKDISIPLSTILYLNSPTIFKKNNLGHLIFEDSVSCNYSSTFVRLKIIQICYSIRQYLPKMNLNSNSKELLDLQKQCSKMIYKNMDLRHLVHEGIDNTRYTGTDVGKLAFYGQGNCHHLASVGAALLYPFGKLLGWEIIFRAGSFFKTGREIDQQGNPLKEWNGKPRVNVEDHTWLQIRYKPSNMTFVYDPSFGICSDPLNWSYSFEGRMHISGKKLNFSLPYEFPSSIFSKQ